MTDRTNRVIAPVRQLTAHDDDFAEAEAKRSNEVALGEIKSPTIVRLVGLDAKFSAKSRLLE